MRWERLWSDLEQQAEALDRDELAAEVHDRTVIEQSSVQLMDRVRASLGLRLRCDVAGGGRWQGVLLGVGSNWFALARSDTSDASDAHGHAPVILPSVAVTAVAGLAPRAVMLDALGPVARRSTLAMALRRLVEAGERVQVHRSQASPLSGRLTVCGQDYVELCDDDAVTWSVPTAALGAVTMA